MIDSVAKPTLTSLHQEIDAALVASDRTALQLQFFQAQVDVVCRELQQLPAAKAQQQLGSLEELLAKIDELAGLLQQDKQALSSTMGAVASSHQAVHAYTKAKKTDG